ncbi:MAG: hypothetical protein ACLTFM_16070, partial [Blautia wexlerae]
LYKSVDSIEWQGLTRCKMQLASFVPMCCSINLLKTKSGRDEVILGGRKRDYLLRPFLLPFF